MRINKYVTIFFAMILTMPFALAKESKLILEDVVMKTVDIDGGHKIMFRKHAGIYYLKKDVKSYEGIKEALLASEKSKSKIKLKTNPNTLEISEVVK